MGGAVRDYSFGLEPKDIDVFYSYQPGVVGTAEGWTYIPRPAPIGGIGVDPEYDLQNQQGQNIIGSVMDFDAPIGDTVYRVQMIGVHFERPALMMDTFDHTLYLAAYTGRSIIFDKRFVKSAKTLEIKTLNDRNPVKTLARINRFIAKTGAEWTIVAA